MFNMPAIIALCLGAVLCVECLVVTITVGTDGAMFLKMASQMLL